MNENINPTERPPVPTQPQPVSQPPIQPAEPVLTPFGQPATPIVPQPPVANGMQPQFPIASAPNPPKKSLPLRWIMLGIALVLLIGLVIGFFVLKSSADNTGAAYTTSTKSYLGEVYDTVTSASSNPATIAADLKEIKKPVLKFELLGGISDDYSEAKKLSDDVQVKVPQLEKKMAAFVGFYNFYQDSERLNREMAALLSQNVTQANAASVFKSVGDKMKEIQTLTEEATFPSEIAGDKEKIVSAIQTCSERWSAVESALNAGDRNGYSAAYVQYSACVAPLRAATAAANEYYTNLTTKVKDSAKDIKTLEGSVTSS